MLNTNHAAYCNQMQVGFTVVANLHNNSHNSWKSSIFSKKKSDRRKTELKSGRLPHKACMKSTIV